MSGESLMATSRWLIVAGQQVNRNRGLLVNVTGVRLKVYGHSYRYRPRFKRL